MIVGKRTYFSPQSDIFFVLFFVLLSSSQIIENVNKGLNAHGDEREKSKLLTQTSI